MMVYSDSVQQVKKNRFKYEKNIKVQQVLTIFRMKYSTNVAANNDSRPLACKYYENNQEKVHNNKGLVTVVVRRPRRGSKNIST